MEEVSVSKLQREMRLGYNKAANIIERMERDGLVGPANGVKPRQLLMRAGTPGSEPGAQPVENPPDPSSGWPHRGRPTRP